MKKRILLIDDHPEDNSNFISALRKDGGYDVDVTAYISTARMKLTQPDRYDLVVIDVMMPILDETFNNIDTEDGLKTGLAYYESELIGKNIPVIFWSWNEDFKKDIEEKKWDKTDFVYKETDDNHLLNGVKRFCKKNNL